jgi:hypothetical protein
MATDEIRDADAGAADSVTTSRRGFLAVAGAASCVVFTGGVARALAPQSEGVRRQRNAAERGTPGHALVASLPVGSALHTSTVAAVHPVKFGAVAVVMRRADGSGFQLDVLQRAERDGSIAQSRHFSVFAVNGGTGRSATAEPDGLAAMALARALVAAEDDGLAALPLLTHAERARRHPLGSYRVVG